MSLTFQVLSISCNAPIQTFFTAQISFWTHRFWCFLGLLAFFVSPLSHWQTISFPGIFHPGKQKKSCRGWQNQVNREGGACGSCHFWSKSAEHSWCPRKSPIMKWANVWKSLPKNSLKPNAASHNNASWYTDTDVFLEHSPSGGSLYYKGPTLQKIIPWCVCVCPLTWSLGLVTWV